MDDKILRRNHIILCLKISLFTQDVVNRLVLTLGRAHCFLRNLYSFSFVGGKYEPSGWLSVEVIAFKILQSCLYKRSLIETGEETKRRLWQRSKKSCIIFKSDSNAPYTERQYVKFGRTKDCSHKQTHKQIGFIHAHERSRVFNGLHSVSL